jgi:uncharacterized cupredoxin-like copper-binding protein
MRRAAAAALLALAAVACGADAGPSERTIAVRMRYSKYEPRTIEVGAGTTVAFVLENADPIEHEFVIGTHAEQLKHEAGDPHDPHTRLGEALLKGSETRRLRYTFRAPGTFEFACHRPGHYRYGMVGTILVKA